MILDLVQIRRMGDKARPENERFRKFLKTHDFPERKLRHIAEDIEDQIDCTQCANCCRVATTTLQERDVEKLARFLRISPSEFMREYTVETEDEGVILRRTDQGCVFLSGNECTVYEARPGTCENFPHMVRGAGSIPSRMWQFIDRACYCPIVYNTLEAYKDELKFRR
jgi:Fe-S-cluster containining protein